MSKGGKVRRLIVNSMPEDNFLVVSRFFLQDENISAPALAVGVYVLSKPPTWEVRPRQIAAHFSIGKNKIYDILNELAKLGYIARRWLKNEKGFFDGCEYIVSDDKEKIEKVKADWRAAGIPVFGEDEGGTADEESITYEEEGDDAPAGESAENKGASPDHPRPENRDTDKAVLPRPDLREAAKRDGEEIKDIYKIPPDPPTAAAALGAQPPSGGQKPPDPPKRRPTLRDFSKFCEDSNLKPFRRDRQRDKALQACDRLDDIEAHKAYGCLRNYITTFKATLAKWHAQGEQGTPPTFNLFDYFQDKAWRKMGIPSDPLELPTPPSAEKILCRRVLDRNKPEKDTAWPWWFNQESADWQAWDEFFKAHGFDGAPRRTAEEFSDEFCGAVVSEIGWRFPTKVPNAPDSLQDWEKASEAVQQGFLQFKKFYNVDAMSAFPDEDYVWILWQSFAQYLRDDALTLFPLYRREYWTKFSDWLVKQNRSGVRPVFARPADFLLGIERGDYEYLHQQNSERAHA